MKHFRQKESYKHLFAKNLLKKWFLEQESLGEFCQVAQFKWRSNYGVFTELEFYESSSPYYFELSQGLIEYRGIDENHKDLRGEDCLNWFDPTFNRGNILFVPDITIFHKGLPSILIEVVHTNPISKWKVERIQKFFKGHYIELYEIESEEILKKDSSCVPPFLHSKRLILDA